MRSYPASNAPTARGAVTLPGKVMIKIKQKRSSVKLIFGKKLSRIIEKYLVRLTARRSGLTLLGILGSVGVAEGAGDRHALQLNPN
jgi:hypothetical protein